jgi:hypothetical protein
MRALAGVGVAMASIVEEEASRATVVPMKAMAGEELGSKKAMMGMAVWAEVSEVSEEMVTHILALAMVDGALERTMEASITSERIMEALTASEGMKEAPTELEVTF